MNWVLIFAAACFSIVAIGVIVMSAAALGAFCDYERACFKRRIDDLEARKKRNRQ